jgi:hypothetical protein
MMGLTLLVIGKDETSLKSFDRENVGDAELVLVANNKREPLSTIANGYLPHSRDVFGLCHANAWFGPGSLEIFTKTAMEWKVCGIVGRGLDLVYRWCQTNSGRVSTLDGCSIFLPVKCNLRFDDTIFNGFHCHVEDLCLQAQKSGIEVVVPSANATHLDSDHSESETRAWSRDYWWYRELLANKWNGTPFSTT